MQSIDRHFAEFVATGEARALARVFDAAANELLAIAFHLLGEAAAAEDCVQETFLVAIESSASFDVSRRVMPWLVGILTNRCRRRLLERARARQRGAQRVEFSGDAADPRGLEPIAIAGEREFRARLDACLALIAEPYRTVLLLRLDDQLGADAIAGRLNRSPSTVRTQLQRGIDRLRQALPKGLAPAAVYVPVRSVAQLREGVLAQVSAADVAAAGTGFVLKLAFGLVGVSALVAGLAFAFGSPEAAPMGSESSRSRFDGDRAVGPSASVAGSSPESLGEPATRFAVEMPRFARQRADETLLFGCCVDAVTGIPLPGCDVTLRARMSMSGPEFATVEDPELPDPTTTDAAGRFLLRVLPTDLHDYELSIASASHTPAWVKWKPPHGSLRFDAAKVLVPGSDRDLGTVRLDRGHRVRGRALDSEGRPAVGVALRVRVRYPSVGRSNSVAHNLYSFSGVDGRFAFEEPLPTGVWRIELAHQKFTAVSLPEVRLRSSDSGIELACVVRAQDSIMGTLSDRTGQPLARVSLRAIDDAGRAIAAARTSKRGSFTLYGTPTEAGAAVRVVPRDPERFRAIEPAAPVFFGARGLRLVSERISRGASAPGDHMEDGPILRLRAVDARSGAPIESFSYNVQQDPRSLKFGRVSTPAVRSRGVVEAPGGTVELRGVAPGPRIAFLHPGDRGYASTGAVSLTMQEQDTEHTVAIAPVEDLRVHVISHDGRAAVGAWLELLAIDDGTRMGTLVGRAIPYAARVRAGARPTVLDTAYTDGDGRVALRLPIDAGRCAVRVTHRWGRQVVAAAVAASAGPGDALEIVFARVPDLVGRLVPADAVRWSATIAACRPGAGPHDMVRHARVGADGGFVLRGLHDGEWVFHLLVDMSNALGGLQERVAISGPLAKFEVGGERERELLFAVDHLRAASLDGTLLGASAADSGASRDAWLECIEGHGGTATLPGFSCWTVGLATIGVDGRFAFDAVPPGRYRLAVRSGVGLAGRVQGVRVFCEHLVFRPGERVKKEFPTGPQDWGPVTLPFDIPSDLDKK